MINLLLLVTLQQYEEFHQKEENPIENFRRIVSAFKNSWNMYSSEQDKGYRIKRGQMINFIMTFNIDFMEHYKISIDNINKYILDLELLV